MKNTNFFIRPLATSNDLEVAKRLFKSYASSLGFSIAFQGFANELSSLPGSYQPPTGVLLLAYTHNEDALGCVAIRPLSHPRLTDGSSIADSSIPLQAPSATAAEKRICECKRLYCVPESRGMGIGGALMDRAIVEAAKLGYEELWLDTLKTMEAANEIYRKRGFVEIEKYNQSLLVGQVYFGLKLC